MSTSSAPPRSSVPKRPWYLVAALIAGWVFGFGSLNDGCRMVAFYQGADIDEPAAQSLTDVQARDEVIALETRRVAVMDAARNRALPLAIASLLLGMAMVMLSLRSMMGRGGARRALVQVVAVQALLIVASHFLIADVRRARADVESAALIAKIREKQPDEARGEQIAAAERAFLKILPSLQLTFRTLASALIVLALTRPRVRAFFDAGAGTLSER